MRPGNSTGLEPKPLGVIRKIAPCTSCGYNLHGVPPDGRCPECGAVIGPSLRRVLIRFSHPRWVSDLRKGLSLLLFGPLLGLASWLLLALTDIVGRVGHDVLTMLTAVGFVLCSSSALGMFIAGVMLLSLSEPRELPETPGRWVRIAFRWGWIPAWAWFLYRMASNDGLPSPFSGSYVVGVAVTGGWLALLILHVSRLAQLLTSRSLRRTSRACLIVLLGTVACVLWLPLCVIADTPTIGKAVLVRPPAALAKLLGRTVTLEQLWRWTLRIALPFFVLSMLLLFGQSRRLFQTAGEQARENWSRPVSRD